MGQQQLQMGNRIQVFLLVVLYFFCISCDENKTNSITKKEIQQEIIFKPDLTINKSLVLNDYNSFPHFYKKSEPPQLKEFIRESPVMLFCNNSKSQYLLAYQYEGGVENSFSLFEIGYSKDIQCDNNTTDHKEFTTESGIKLGISLDEVIALKGSSYSKQGNSIKYKIDDYANSKFLQEYNMPQYSLECILENQKVIKIIFGFEYP